MYDFDIGAHCNVPLEIELSFHVELKGAFLSVRLSACFFCWRNIHNIFSLDTNLMLYTSFSFDSEG